MNHEPERMHEPPQTKMEDKGSMANIANIYREDGGKSMNGRSIKQPLDDSFGASHTMRTTPSAPKPRTTASRLAYSSINATSRLHPRDNFLTSSLAFDQNYAESSQTLPAAITIDTVSPPASSTALSSPEMALTPITASSVGTATPLFSFSPEAKKDLELSYIAQGSNGQTKTMSTLQRNLATKSDCSASSSFQSECSATLQSLGSQKLILQQRETVRLERILEREEQCIAELAKSKKEARVLSQALDEERTMHSEIVAELEVKLHNLEACLAEEKEKGTSNVTQLVDRVSTAESERDEVLDLLDEALNSLRKEQSAAAEIAAELALVKGVAEQEKADFDLRDAAYVEQINSLDQQLEHAKQKVIEHSEQHLTADAELVELKAKVEQDCVRKELENERSTSSELAALLNEAKRNAEEVKVRFEEQINRLAEHLGEMINMDQSEAEDNDGDCGEVQPNPSTDDDSPIDEMDEHVLACLIMNP